MAVFKLDSAKLEQTFIKAKAECINKVSELASDAYYQKYEHNTDYLGEVPNFKTDEFKERIEESCNTFNILESYLQGAIDASEDETY